MEYNSGPSDDFNNQFVDDTFKCTRTLFTKIYTIHVLTINSLIPTVYVYYQTNHKKHMYTSLVLNQLNKIKSTLSLKLIVPNSEMASINVFKKTFPSLKQKYNKFNIWPYIIFNIFITDVKYESYQYQHNMYQKII